MEKQTAPFESRNPSRPAVFAVGEPKYRGINRRHRSRRDHEDRRGDIRFEMEKPGRRDGVGRRCEDSPDLEW